MTLLIKVFFICIFAMAVLSETSEQDSLLTLSDDNIAMILKNRRYIERILKCVQGDVPCDQYGMKIKGYAPSILRNHCPGCNLKEESQMKRIIYFIQTNYPKEWAKIVKHYSG